MNAQPLDSTGVEALKQARLAQERANASGLGGIVQEATATPQTQYETFLEISNLPSKGMFYSAPIKGQALKVEDILLLSNFDNDNYQDKFNEVFLRRIQGSKPREIVACDELYLAFWLRESSFPGIGFPGDGHICKHCGFENPPQSVTFSFKDMTFTVKDFDKISKEFKEGNGKIVVVLPQSKKEFTISLPRRGHNDRYMDVIKKDYTVNGAKPPKDIEQLLPIASLLNIGIQDIRDVVQEIKALPLMDFGYLVKKVTSCTMNPEIEVAMPCLKCQEVTPTSGYSFPADFFLPLGQL